MGIPVSLFLIAVGAILAFVVNQDPDPVLWERLGPGAWGWHRGSYDAAARPGYLRRRTVVEEEEGPPPGPPPDAPPPP